MTNTTRPEKSVDNIEPVSDDSGNHVQVTQQAAWSGPFPPPAILEQFNGVVENGAERIFRAWESETNHRQKEERRELTLFALDNYLGKIFAFIFVIVALGISAYAATHGAEWFATILGGGTIASVVWAFVKSSSPSKNNGE
ncbi:MAG: DUF2335 domain-containing protein [Pseudomonadota bacterium]